MNPKSAVSIFLRKNKNGSISQVRNGHMSNSSLTDDPRAVSGKSFNTAMTNRWSESLGREMDAGKMHVVPTRTDREPIKRWSDHLLK